MSDLRVPSGPGLPEGLVVPAEELVERFSRSGSGGQSVNTTDSRVELVSRAVRRPSAPTPTERGEGRHPPRASPHRAPLAAAPQPGRGARAAGRRDRCRARPAAPAAGPDQAVEVLPPAPDGGQEAARPHQGAAWPGARLTAESARRSGRVATRSGRVATRSGRVVRRTRTRADSMRTSGDSARRRHDSAGGVGNSTFGGEAAEESAGEADEVLQRAPQARQHEDRPDRAEDDDVDRHRVRLLGELHALGAHPDVEE